MQNDKISRYKNMQLKDDLKKMTRSFNDLKKKFAHFEIHDDITFNSIYKMNAEEAKDLAIKVALADKTIKTQQLGIEIVKDKDNEDGFSIEQLQKEKDEEEVKNNEEVKEIVNNDNFRETILAKVPSERVKEVFTYIIQDAEFLIELDTIEKCKNMTLDQKLPIYIESISKALGIKTLEDMKDLLAVFNSHSKNNQEEVIKDMEENENLSENENEEKINQVNEKNNALVIDADDVLEYLKEFFEKKKNKNKEQMLGNITSNNVKSSGAMSEEEKREKMRYLGEVYWKKLSSIISDKTYNVWKALDKALLKYHDLLFERKQLINDTKSLYDENKELKIILKGYLDSNLNDALKIPPTQTIKIDYKQLSLNSSGNMNIKNDTIASNK